MNDDEDRLINEFLNTLIQSPTQPEEVQICPIWGGKLHVGFSAYKRFGEDLFGVNLDCESCDISMALDSAGPLPIWLTSD
jgi:hypothetical protein